jgi:hypothetical protein
LSKELTTAFPNITPIARPFIPIAGSLVTGCAASEGKIEYTHWLAGFCSGECSFIVKIVKSSTQRQGFQVTLRFSLAQHSRDEQLMVSLMKYFDCGHLFKKQKESNLE